MSWASKKINQVRNKTDQLGKDLGLNESQRKWFRVGVSTMGGGMGLQYEYSRNKGMNSQEAMVNAAGGGMTYANARGDQKAREAEESATEMAERQAVVTRAEATRARLATQVRVRRSGRGNRPTTHGGTLVTGALGLPGTATPDRATKLGL